MTDAERERVKMKVRKKEADGGLTTRLLYTGCRIPKGTVVYAKETRRLRYSTARSSTTRCPPCCPERRERERRAGTEYT